MFCDGKCREKNNEGFERRCPQLYSITLFNNITKKEEIVEKCFTNHFIDIGLRIETALIRIQAAVEDARNEEAVNEIRTGNIVATGMVGMMHAFNQDPEKFKKALGLIDQAFKNGEQKIVDIQNHRSDKLKEIE